MDATLSRTLWCLAAQVLEGEMPWGSAAYRECPRLKGPVHEHATALPLPHRYAGQRGSRDHLRAGWPQRQPHLWCGRGPCLGRRRHDYHHGYRWVCSTGAPGLAPGAHLHLPWGPAQAAAWAWLQASGFWALCRPDAQLAGLPTADHALLCIEHGWGMCAAACCATLISATRGAQKGATRQYLPAYVSGFRPVREFHPICIQKGSPSISIGPLHACRVWLSGARHWCPAWRAQHEPLRPRCACRGRQHQQRAGAQHGQSISWAGDGWRWWHWDPCLPAAQAHAGQVSGQSSLRMPACL